MQNELKWAYLLAPVQDIKEQHTILASNLIASLLCNLSLFKKSVKHGH